MNSRLLLAGSLKTLARYKLRTFLMGVGVALGVASLVAGRSLGTGAEREIGAKVDKIFGPGTIIVIARASGRAPQTGPATTLKISDFEAIAERLDQVVAWDPSLGAGMCDISTADANLQAAVLGHSERAVRVWNRGVVEGRHFTADDLASTARVALLGTRIAATLFPDSSPIDAEILINRVPFRVVGVLEPIGIDPHGQDRDEDIVVPTTTVMRRLRNVDFIGSVKLVVRDPDSVDRDAEQVAAILRERHGIAPGEADDFAIFSSKFAGRHARNANRTLKIYLPAGAGVVLFLAAMVISNVMLTVVRQRVGEIGLRKAVGATETHVNVQFLAEALAVTVTSGIMGLLLGVAIVMVAAPHMELPVVITPDALVLGFGATVVVGIVSGLAPARRAARLDPVEALR